MNDLIQIEPLNKPKTELVQLTKKDWFKLMDRMIQQIENREFLDNYLETIRRLNHNEYIMNKRLNRLEK